MRRLLEGHHNGVSIVHTGKLRISRNSTAPKTGNSEFFPQHAHPRQWLLLKHGSMFFRR
jgi:hypothetical protein